MTIHCILITKTEEKKKKYNTRNAMQASLLFRSKSSHKEPTHTHTHTCVKKDIKYKYKLIISKNVKIKNANMQTYFFVVIVFIHSFLHSFRFVCLKIEENGN